MILKKFSRFIKVFERSPIIIQMMRKVTKKALTGFGAYVRTVARRSMGTGEEVSAPGDPPTSRTKVLKNTTLFGVQMDRLSVVIGPRYLGPSKKVMGLVPPLLEYGGRTLIRTKNKKRWRRALYRARPFMGPAFKKSLPYLPAIWEKARLR